MTSRAPWIFLLLSVLLLLFLLVQNVNTKSESRPTKKTAAIEQVADVPKDALQAYQNAGSKKVPWQLLLAIGEAESDHGRSPLPGVRSGINSADCCAGPMQLCVRDSCGNVASVYARDGDRDGAFSVYDIDDATATASAYLAWMQQLVGKSPELLAAAYNAGPTIVSKEGIPPYPETEAYVAKVTKRLSSLR